VLAGAHHGDGDLVHQRPDELLAVGGGWRGPQAFDVAGQGGDGPLLSRGEGLGAGAGEPVVVLSQALLGGQRGFPVGFQLPHHQAVLRLGQPIAAPRPIGGDRSALQSLLPDPLQLGPLGLHLLGCLQGDLDRGWGQRGQDLLGDQRVDTGPARAWQRWPAP
jgi:hypothetical protein